MICSFEVSNMTKEEMLDIETSCLEFLDNESMAKLRIVLQRNLDINGNGPLESDSSFDVPLEKFLDAKRVEGCSQRSLQYYRYILALSLGGIGKPIGRITTDDLRQFLNKYSDEHRISKSSSDNIRRVLSSFFSWLEEEDFIMKSPMRRIHKIKGEKVIKEPFSDEDVEHIKDACRSIRDIAIVDMLLSTGMRVGELVRLKIADISMEKRECVVLGKGQKERIVYFDFGTKVRMQAYLSSRDDDSPYAFIGTSKKHLPLKVSGIESIIRKLGIAAKISKCHPHRFRRTLATKAIHKGIPIEQVQKILGHAKIETTLRYAIVEQSNVRNSYQRLFS